MVACHVTHVVKAALPGCSMGSVKRSFVSMVIVRDLGISAAMQSTAEGSVALRQEKQAAASVEQGNNVWFLESCFPGLPPIIQLRTLLLGTSMSRIDLGCGAVLLRHRAVSRTVHMKTHVCRGHETDGF